MTDVKIDLIEEPDGRYRLTARIAGVTYLTDRFALLSSGLRFDYAQLLAHEAALILAARPTPDSPEFEYDTRTRYERALDAAKPSQPAPSRTHLPTWMREDTVVQVPAGHGWIKGFLANGTESGTDTGEPAVEVMVFQQDSGLGLHHPDSLTHVPDPSPEVQNWIESEKRALRMQTWRGLRQRSSGIRVYRLEEEAEALASTLVPRGDLSDPRIVDIDLWAGQGAGEYRDDLPDQHRLTLQVDGGELHTGTFGGTGQVHARATALLLDAFGDPETALPAWRLRSDEDRVLEEQLKQQGLTSDEVADLRPLLPGQIVRTPASESGTTDFGRVDHLMTAGFVAVVRVGQGPALFPPEQLTPYEPTAEEQPRLEALDRQIRHDVRVRAEREAGSLTLNDHPVTPDLY
ncbi:hypothetical protein LWF15_16140 [Kineosporia rhizophila]|uniref:hypothetical protein n=1 Tax=Kineosporia rhizophila TaxID=84633 RepID=UPI001E5024D5|nr:hypothetical protein [Kineosporia rhizophila]MCE0537032.1 hypothetical protein [Kineosporia rhizophila]